MVYGRTVVLSPFFKVPVAVRKRLALACAQISTLSLLYILLLTTSDLEIIMGLTSVLYGQ